MVRRSANQRIIFDVLVARQKSRFCWICSEASLQTTSPRETRIKSRPLKGGSQNPKILGKLGKFDLKGGCIKYDVSWRGKVNKLKNNKSRLDLSERLYLLFSKSCPYYSEYIKVKGLRLIFAFNMRVLNCR